MLQDQLYIAGATSGVIYTGRGPRSAREAARGPRSACHASWPSQCSSHLRWCKHLPSTSRCRCQLSAPGTMRSCAAFGELAYTLAHMTSRRSTASTTHRVAPSLLGLWSSGACQWLRAMTCTSTRRSGDSSVKTSSPSMRACAPNLWRRTPRRPRIGQWQPWPVDCYTRNARRALRSFVRVRRSCASAATSCMNITGRKGGLGLWTR